jgi:hypothetical protein
MGLKYRSRAVSLQTQSERVCLRRGKREEAATDLDYAAQMTASHDAEQQLRLYEAHAQLAELRAEQSK